MMLPVCAAVIIVIWRIEWRHDNEQRKRRVNQAAGEQDQDMQALIEKGYVMPNGNPQPPDQDLNNQPHIWEY